jgi:hypothetical protein
MIAIAVTVALMTATHAGEPAGVRTASPPKPEKIRKGDTVCRYEAVVGSRMPRRICTTRAEWEDRSATDRLAVEKAQNIQPL